METKSGIVLENGEEIIHELEAEMYSTSSNPIAMAFGGLIRIFDLIVGNKKNAFLVITNKRVFELQTQIRLWVFTVGKTVRYILPSSVKEVGYLKAASCCCFCPTYYFYYDAHTQTSRLQMKTMDESQVKKIVDDFYAKIQK